MHLNQQLKRVRNGYLRKGMLFSITCTCSELRKQWKFNWVCRHLAFKILPWSLLPPSVPMSPNVIFFFIHYQCSKMCTSWCLLDSAFWWLFWNAMVTELLVLTSFLPRLFWNGRLWWGVSSKWKEGKSTSALIRKYRLFTAIQIGVSVIDKYEFKMSCEMYPFLKDKNAQYPLK